MQYLVFISTALLLLGSSGSPKCCADNYWPGWLGPERNGWVNDFQPPVRWPEKLERVWHVEVGSGYGTPIVSGERVYQHARQGADEVLWCFELSGGRKVWRNAHPMPFKMGGGGESHGKGPKSNPLLADGRVFTMSITGVLSAWDASTGESLWHQDYSARFKKGHPNWGATTSPIVDGNRLFVHFGGDDAGVLVALDVASGQEIWSQGSDGAAYSSPLVVDIEGVRQVVEWNHRALIGVEVETGKLLWEYSFPHVGSNQNMPTPSFYEGRVFVGGENRGVRCVEPRLKGEVWSASEIWYQKKVALDMSSAVVNNNLLFGFSHLQMGRLFCVDTKSGEILWQGPGRTGENVAFLSIPDHVVALINNGELRILAARADAYQVVASYQVAESPTWSAPVLMESGILVKDANTLSLWAIPTLTASSVQ